MRQPHIHNGKIALRITTSPLPLVPTTPNRLLARSNLGIVAMMVSPARVWTSSQSLAMRKKSNRVE